ncbi:MAG: hypothetical protein PHQ32_04730 [Firmicutes bacterium]|nr:hypothetical protein [Bacillota bacterium]
MVGDLGAAYDLGQSAILVEKISQAKAEGIIIGSVCHDNIMTGQNQNSGLETCTSYDEIT